MTCELHEGKCAAHNEKCKLCPLRIIRWRMGKPIMRISKVDNRPSAVSVGEFLKLKAKKYRSVK